MPRVFFLIFYNAGGTGAWRQFKCWSFWPLSDRRRAIKHGVIVFMLESNFCCQTEGCNAIDTCRARLHASVLVFIASARTAIRVPSPEPKGMCVCILSKKKVWIKGQFQHQTALAVSHARTRKQISDCQSQFPWRRSLLVFFLTLHLFLSLVLQVRRWEGVYTLSSDRRPVGPGVSGDEPPGSELSPRVRVL